MTYKIQKFFSIVFLLISFLSISAKAWEVNTHRAMDREASNIATNLDEFMNSAKLDKGESYRDKYDHYLSYETTYFNYITHNKKENGVVYNDAMSEIDIEFKKHNYKDLIEAGSILEDATWPVAQLFGGNGRFFNHFLNPQDNNSGFIAGINALTWANGVVTNLYSYKKARYYMKQAFINSTVEERKLNTAKMFVSLGHIMHLFNDMNVPAHTRNDGYNPDYLEWWMRGGDECNGTTGFYILGNTQAGELKGLTSKANKFVDFNTSFISEANHTSINFCNYSPPSTTQTLT